MIQEISFVKRIGNFLSNILLGETKELIVRTDERVQIMSGNIEGLRSDLSKFKEGAEKRLGVDEKRICILEARMDIIWGDRVAPVHSPRQLNEIGSKILQTSGIKEIVDAKQNELLELVRVRKADNPYDAEQAIYDVMQKLPEHHPEIMKTLKDGAFKNGTDPATVLFVGAIYLRDLIFKKLGFALENNDPT